MFRWKKLGKVFTPQQVEGRSWLKEFAQAPAALVFNDFVRIYFSCRPPADENGQYVSYSAYVELDRTDLFKVRHVCEQPILSLGGLGELCIAGNTNGHPANWQALRVLAEQHGLHLIEDSTEAIGSRYKGTMVGKFGDCAIFDFSQPSALCCGEGAMIVTDDLEFARNLRYLRDRQPEQRHSISISRLLPLNARISELTAALGIAQLRRIDDILAKRRQVTRWYEEQIESFEGIKPPYLAPDVDEVNWFLYTVHLGTRFSHSSCRAIVDDMRTAEVEADLYSYPLYLERYYIEQGWRKGSCFVTEKVADRAIALPFHTHLTEEQIAFIVKTAKDASINVGAGAAIYL